MKSDLPDFSYQESSKTYRSELLFLNLECLVSLVIPEGREQRQRRPGDDRPAPEHACPGGLLHAGFVELHPALDTGVQERYGLNQHLGG